MLWGRTTAGCGHREAPVLEAMLPGAVTGPDARGTSCQPKHHAVNHTGLRSGRRPCRPRLRKLELTAGRAGPAMASYVQLLSRVFTILWLPGVPLESSGPPRPVPDWCRSQRDKRSDRATGALAVEGDARLPEHGVRGAYTTCYGASSHPPSPEAPLIDVSLRLRPSSAGASVGPYVPANAVRQVLNPVLWPPHAK